MSADLAFDSVQTQAILARTPAILAGLLDGLGPEWVAANDDREDWSPHAVLGHLIHGELTDWMPRIRTILDHGVDRPFDPFDREAMFAMKDGTTTERLDRFASLRRENLKALRAMSLSASDLDRRGRHPELGEVTLRQTLATWTIHDLTHIAQISNALARRYTAEVGPWLEFFPDLTRG